MSFFGKNFETVKFLGHHPHTFLERERVREREREI